MDRKAQRNNSRRTEWRFGDGPLVILYIFLLVIQCNCQTIPKQSSQETKREIKNVDNKLDKHCHSCHSSNFEDNNKEDITNTNDDTLIDNVVGTLSTLTEKYSLVNKTINYLENNLEDVLDNAMSTDRYTIVDGVEIISLVNSTELNKKQENSTEIEDRSEKEATDGRALFSKYTYEYRLFQKIKTFFETHGLSINLPKAAKMIAFRSFGLNKFFVPLLIGGQVILKSIFFAMFLPSILGSFGKILGKGISQLSAASSQASYPPAQMDDQSAYNSDNKDFMGYETNPAGSYAYPQDDMYGHVPDANDVNDLSNIDMSRFGMGGQTYMPTKNGYYKNQMTSGNNYKVFQKIPASSMILSNYDPFYSPLLSRLDGIFARLGLAPTEPSEDIKMQIGGQSLSDVKLEACREQLICLMYSSPAKYAPYSNLVSAQLSRELNELRRPVSDNPEILRFFRYMRAARQGQEGTECMQAHPVCTTNTQPEHTMIAAYHDINKLVTARKLNLWGWQLNL